MDSIIILVYSYLILGIYLFFYKTRYNSVYLLVLLFCSFKVITNYRICSVAYLECRLRNVQREDSYMNQLLDPIVDLRYTDHAYPLTLLSFIILTYNFVYLKRFKEITF